MDANPNKNYDTRQQMMLQGGTMTNKYNQNLEQTQQ